MDEGYILSNKYRRAIFDELASGESDIRRIAKKHRIVSSIVDKVKGTTKWRGENRKKNKIFSHQIAHIECK